MIGHGTSTSPSKKIACNPGNAPGYIRTSFFSRISVVAHCDMDLHMYPMDTQTCELRIESCEYKNDIT